MTDLQQTAQQLDHVRTVNLHLRMAVDQISEGVVILEAEPLAMPGPRMVYVNRGLCRMAGCRPEDLLGQPISMLFDAERVEAFLATLPKVAEAGRTFQTRSFLHTRDGGRKFCRWTVSCVRDSRGQPLNYTITMAEDNGTPTQVVPAEPVDRGMPNGMQPPVVPPAQPVAERALTLEEEKMEDDRMVKLARLEDLEVIASGIAHDFRNDLTAVMLNLNNAVTAGPGGDHQLELLQNAAAAAQHAKELADQLMEHARGGTPKRRVSDLGGILRECAQLALSGSQCEKQVLVADDLWPVKVDPTQIKQVVNNLLINANQAMAGGGMIFASVSNISLPDPGGLGLELKPGRYVLVRVHDRGEGIPDHVQPNIFKRNFTTKKTGNGLGLASSYHIVRSHQGLINFESRVGVGTEFRVFLPACEATVPLPVVTEPVPDVRPAARTMRGGGRMVLVVEDQVPVRAAVRESLKALDYVCEEAGTAEQALGLFRQRLDEGRPFYVVLMDLTLPGGLNGDDAMKSMRQMDARARVVACSGALGPDALETCRRLGYVDVLPKPFDVDHLMKVLHYAGQH